MRANRKRIWYKNIFEPTEFLTADLHRYRYPPHVHDVFSIQAVDLAPQKFETKAGRETLLPQTLTAINPGEVHAGWCAQDTRWRYRMFHPSTALVARCLGIEGEKAERLGFASHVIDDARLFQLFGRLHNAAADDHDELERQQLMVDFVRRLFSRFADYRSATTDTCARVAADCRAYIDAHFRDNMGLDTLADAVGVSEAHAIRSFRAAFGISPGAYRNALRIECAKKRLAAGTSIVDTASELGYYDQSHFHKAFRKIVGVAPGRYAQSL